LSNRPALFRHPRNRGVTDASGVKRVVTRNQVSFFLLGFPCKSQVNGEPTSGLEPLT
jgi:hypothetical protein